MKSRMFVLLALVALGWPSVGTAQTACPNPLSEGGICPILVPGDPTCDDAAQICGVDVDAAQSLFFPSPGTRGTVTVTAAGAKWDVVDTASSLNQQTGRPGMEIVLARRGSTFVYCGASILHERVSAPGPVVPNQLTVCFAKGPCRASQGDVGTACTAYGGTADFLQAYQVGPTEQTLNICGCGNFRAQFCDLRPATTVGGDQSFVACNQGTTVLKSIEAEGTATIGANTCTMRIIGGRRVLIDDTTGQLCK